MHDVGSVKKDTINAACKYRGLGLLQYAAVRGSITARGHRVTIRMFVWYRKPTKHCIGKIPASEKSIIFERNSCTELYGSGKVSSRDHVTLAIIWYAANTTWRSRVS